MARCLLTDLLEEQCAHCLGHLAPDEEQDNLDKEFLRNIKSWGK